MISGNVLHEVRRILRSFPVASCLLDREPRYIAANQRYSEIFRKDLDHIIGSPMVNIAPPRFIQNVHRDFRIFDAGASVPDHEVELDGRKYLVSVGSIASEQTGEIIAISVALTDITRLKRVEHELEEANRSLSKALYKITEIAETDQLTGLHNRHAFEMYLMKEIARIKRTRTPVSAILIDVDLFKAYNDLYGHVQGDDCLRAVATAIQQGTRRIGDFSARYGGEEFVVILPDTDLPGAAATAQRIQEAIAACAIRHDGSPFQSLSVSIGVFCLPLMPAPLDIKNIRELILTGADRALYHAKQNGRNTIHIADMEVF